VRPAIGAQLDDAHRREPAQRFAHRAAADPVAFRQFGFGQALARIVAPLVQSLNYVPRDSLARAVAVRFF
jgi:hypothetical protein